MPLEAPGGLKKAMVADNPEGSVEHLLRGFPAPRTDVSYPLYVFRGCFGVPKANLLLWF